MHTQTGLNIVCAWERDFWSSFILIKYDLDRKMNCFRNVRIYIRFKLYTLLVHQICQQISWYMFFIYICDLNPGWYLIYLEFCIFSESLDIVILSSNFNKFFYNIHHLLKASDILSKSFLQNTHRHSWKQHPTGRSYKQGRIISHAVKEGTTQIKVLCRFYNR